MQLGLTFRVDGYLTGKRTYDDKSGVRQYGADVAWMGGNEFFLMSRELWERLPDATSGAAIILSGTMEKNRFGVRFNVTTIGDSKSARAAS